MPGKLFPLDDVNEYYIENIDSLFDHDILFLTSTPEKHDKKAQEFKGIQNQGHEQDYNHTLIHKIFRATNYMFSQVLL